MKRANTIRNRALQLVVVTITTLLSLMAVPRVARAQSGDSDNATHTVTGCLRQGDNAQLFRLTDENGKMWNLRSSTVRMHRHVGQTVTVTGTIPQQSTDGSETAPQNDLAVTSLATVQNSCKQP